MILCDGNTYTHIMYYSDWYCDMIIYKVIELNIASVCMMVIVTLKSCNMWLYTLSVSQSDMSCNLKFLSFL